ncbi:MAG: glycosyltransferase family 4 protein [Phycisphaerales bacterium JB043]
MDREPSQPDARSLRIVILNQPFAPDVVATAQIAKDFADACVDRGHTVRAIASRSIYGQTGSSLPRRETLDGIEVIRVGSNVFGKKSTLGRLFDFAMYYCRALWVGLFGPRQDVIVCLTTPPYIAFVALMIRLLRGGKVVYWLMDIYPDVMIAHDMIRERGVVHRVLRRLHRSILKRVNATIVLGRCMEERLVAQGAPPDKISVIPVWGVTDESAHSHAPALSNPYRVQWDVGDRCLVMYSGNFGLAHDVQTFLDGALRARDDDRYRFALVGGGKRKERVATFVTENGLDSCAVEPYQPRERLGELLSAADVHLVTMESAWWGLVVPSKFFGVGAIGRPVLFIGPAQSEIARLINEWECGYVIEPGDVDALLESLDALASDSELRVTMGRRASEMSASVSRRSACTDRMLEVIEGVVGERKR